MCSSVTMLATTLWWNSFCKLLLRLTAYMDYGQQWIYASVYDWTLIIRAWFRNVIPV